MNTGSETSFLTIADRLARRDEVAFEQVFKDHFKGLHAYAATILKDDFLAEEVVQQVFFRLWERAEGLSFTSSPAAYLYRAVHNESMNHLKHNQVRAKHRLHAVRTSKPEQEPVNTAELRELEEQLREALLALPEQCRTIFQLSRFEELKYREIADKLGISVKTVENQVGKALKLLREKMVEVMICFILIHLF